MKPLEVIQFLKKNYPKSFFYNVNEPARGSRAPIYQIGVERENIEIDSRLPKYKIINQE